MEKEHIYRGGRNERGVTPEYLDSTRAESVELRATPSDRVVLFFLCLISALPLSPPSAYLLSFLRGFCLRWKGNRGASRVTGPTVFFSSPADPSLSLRSSPCPPLSFRFLPAQAQANSSPPNDKIARFCQLSSVGRYWFPRVTSKMTLSPLCLYLIAHFFFPIGTKGEVRSATEFFEIYSSSDVTEDLQVKERFKNDAVDTSVFRL